MLVGSRSLRALQGEELTGYHLQADFSVHLSLPHACGVPSSDSLGPAMLSGSVLKAMDACVPCLFFTGLIES